MSASRAWLSRDGPEGSTGTVEQPLPEGFGRNRQRFHIETPQKVDGRSHRRKKVSRLHNEPFPTMVPSDEG
jgi:hypothetical protein